MALGFDLSLVWVHRVYFVHSRTCFEHTMGGYNRRGKPRGNLQHLSDHVFTGAARGIESLMKRL